MEFQHEGERNGLSGKVAWKIPLMDLASSAGMLATDGGLLFTGLLTGELIGSPIADEHKATLAGEYAGPNLP